MTSTLWPASVGAAAPPAGDRTVATTHSITIVETDQPTTPRIRILPA
ncbi:MAG: hypothetical protein IGR92_12935 [Leptolyngbyaceae cyanobacterium T60_A2020_046]|nr:hypothetical protein [Leptolyngbyaceae cyanobacterium T60_A2020_046]